LENYIEVKLKPHITYVISGDTHSRFERALKSQKNSKIVFVRKQKRLRIIQCCGKQGCYNGRPKDITQTPLITTTTQVLYIFTLNCITVLLIILDSQSVSNQRCVKSALIGAEITIVILKGYLPIENVRLLDATICTLSNKTIIMPVRFFYEFKMILTDFGGGVRE
jgi:hypothetical protein